MKKDEMVAEVIRSVRQFVGPVAAFKTAIIVDALPKVFILNQPWHGNSYLGSLWSQCPI
jgi:hypothetical protein